MKTLTSLLTLSLLMSMANADKEIGFIEKFALADDRAEVLRELVPGTEEYYYFHALHYQTTDETSKYREIINQWAKRFERSSLREEIENRQALLSYEKDPKGTLEYLKRKLRLNFNHQREVKREKPDLPDTLDQKRIAYEVYLKDALRRSSSTSQISNYGLDALLRDEAKLKVSQERDLLKRLTRPDFPNLVALVNKDLKRKESRGFGEFNIHRALLPEQLEELQQLNPKLRNNTAFVHTRLQKMLPDEDTDMFRDDKVRADYLERAWNYVSKLEASFNSLKAHLLYQRLSLLRSQGTYDRKLFTEYIQLPREVHYIAKSFRKDPLAWKHPANIGARFDALTRCPPIVRDEPLVREHLLHFFVKANDYSNFATYISEDYLKPLFAEAKILSGSGNQEKWFSMLSPSAYQALKDRVDIDFVPTNPKRFEIDDTVELDLEVKNVGKLLVKVYEINTANYYRSFQQEISTDLNLDGLVATNERSEEYDEPPLLRKRRSFSFPELKGRGVWIIEFIGNSKSSRAVVRKGDLQFITRPSSAGNVLTIIDESLKPVEDGYVIMGGRRFDSGKDNAEILIPFSSDTGNRKITLHDGKGIRSPGKPSPGAGKLRLTCWFLCRPRGTPARKRSQPRGSS